jgi:phage baseplate assembly protein W
MTAAGENQFLDGIFAAGGSVLDRLRLLLEVVPGERPLLPEFGCVIHQLPSLAGVEERQIAGALVEETIERWMPRLGVERVEVLSASEGRARLALRVRGSWHDLDLELRKEPPGGERGDDSP